MVSVIITTYKRAEFLERAIDSVLNQSYKDIEIIVVDDNGLNSPYSIYTQNVMKKYSSNDKIKYIQHKTNKNGAAARNTGIKASVGEYITFLDDDDFFLKNRISELVKKIQTSKDVYCVYTDYVDIKNGNIIHVSKKKLNGNLLNDMLYQNSFFGTGSNLFFKSSSIKKLGGFDESFQRHQDIELMVRFFNEGFNVDYINSVSLVRDQSNPINFPNIGNMIKYREHFLHTFKSIIDAKPSKNDIYIKNYTDLLNFCKKRDDNYFYIIKRIHDYGGKITKLLFLKKRIKTLLRSLKKIKRKFLVTLFLNKSITTEIHQFTANYKDCR